MRDNETLASVSRNATRIDVRTRLENRAQFAIEGSFCLYPIALDCALPLQDLGRPKRALFFGDKRKTRPPLPAVSRVSNRSTYGR
jgi:hypothetical protein